MEARIVATAAWLSVIAVLAPCVAVGEQQTDQNAKTTVTNAGPIVPFLEGTDVFFAVGQDSVFEADILHHAIAMQNFVDLLDLDRQATRARPRMFAVSVSGTPAVRLRMLEQVSRPVRTPSWMPRGNVQLLWARGVPEVVQRFSANRAALDEPGAARRTDLFAGTPDVSVWEVHAIVGHHSNGQDGCYYEDQRRGDDDRCRSVEPPSEPRQINITDGSFSTNYIRTGMNYRRNVLDDELWAKLEWGFRGGIEYHPRAWMDEDIVDDYGRTRFDVGAAMAARDWSWCRKRVDVSGGLRLIIGRPGDTSSAAVTLQASCFPTTRGGWGFFVRYYYGQDYYNIRFFNDISRLHLGFTFNQSGFFRFCRGCTEGGGGVQ